MIGEETEERLHAPVVNRSMLEARAEAQAQHEGEVSEVTQVTENSAVASEEPGKTGSLETSTLYPANPEDFERPTRGLAKIRQSIEDRSAKSKNREAAIIPPSKQEAHQRQLRRIARKKDEVEKWTMGRKRIVVVVNAKGGAGKTPLTGYLCNIQMDLTRVPTMCVDANENAGSMHSLFGILREQSLQLRDAVAHRDYFSTYDTLAHFSFKHRSGVLLIASDGEKTNKPVLTIEAYVEAAKIWNKIFPPLYFDSGNGFGDVSNLGTMMVANAVIFAALVDKPSSFEHMVETMIAYQNTGFDAKVKNGFIVVNATKPGDTKRTYLEKIAAELKKFPKKDVFNPETNMTSNVERRLEDLGISEDRLFLIPSSPHIQREDPLSIDENVIGLDTYEAYLDLIIAMYRQNAEYPDMTLETLNVSEPNTTDTFAIPGTRVPIQRRSNNPTG